MKQNAAKRFDVIHSSKREYSLFSSVSVTVRGLSVRLTSEKTPFSRLHVYDLQGNAICLHVEETTFLSVTLPRPGTYLMACTVGESVETGRISVSGSGSDKIPVHNPFTKPTGS